MSFLYCASLIALFALSTLSAQPAPAKPKPAQKPSPPATKAAGVKVPQAQPATQPAPSTPDAPKPWNLSSEPSLLKAGQTYTLPVRLPAAECTQDAVSNFTSLDKVVAATAASIDVKSPAFDMTGDHCTIAVHLTVKDDAPAGKDNLIFYTKPETDKTATIAGLLTVTIQNTKAVLASPIPPNLKPQVDIMWKVLPRQAVADNYGDRVADGFFAVEATIGNNTGYDLQLAALGFETPDFVCLELAGTEEYFEWETPDLLPYPYRGKLPTMVPCYKSSEEKGFLWRSPDKILSPTVPVDAYPVVRGTVEREQFVGTRAIVVNIIKSSGSVLVGVGSAYLNGTGGLFNPAVAIFGTSFEKGLELIYPDLTTTIWSLSITAPSETVLPYQTTQRSG